MTGDLRRPSFLFLSCFCHDAIACRNPCFEGLKRTSEVVFMGKSFLLMRCHLQLSFFLAGIIRVMELVLAKILRFFKKYAKTFATLN